MAKQNITWTALPNGTTDGGRTLRLSVQVAPRLGLGKIPVYEKVPTTVPLSEYPDFLDWASADISFQVHFGNGPTTTARPVAGRRPDVWRAIFTGPTEVVPYNWDDVWVNPSAQQFRSYPVAKIASFLSGMYRAVAVESPLSWPSIELLGRAGLSEFPGSGGAPGTLVPGPNMDEVLASLEDLYDRRAGAIPPGTVTTTAQDIALAATFLAAFPQQGKAARRPRGQVAAAGARTSSAARPVKGPVPLGAPSFEFHQALSLLANHPPLARLLGLVLDLEIPRPGNLPPTYQISVTATWSPHTATEESSPATMTAGTPFRPLERPSSPELAGGYLRLEGPGYAVVGADLDGAALKNYNLANGTRNALEHKAADTPTNYALPALRSAGLSVAREANAYALALRLLDADQTNSQLQGGQPTVLYAEDVTRGYRVDVWDDRSRAWHPLCARVASPAAGGYLVGNPPQVVPVPSGDEGWIQTATTSAAQSGTNAPAKPVGDQNVPETLFRWNGWSLAAPRPGAHLPDGGTSNLATNDQSAAAPGLPVTIEYSATPGTLPVLRFGREYRFQARAVDLAGNSVGLRPQAIPAPLVSTPPVRYLRLEPVASPFLLFKAPRTPGEHLELLVIRSNYDVPDSDPSIGTCERHVVPPPVAEELAELHGKIDGSDGRPSPSQYAMLAQRASATYNDPAVASANGGKQDPGSLGQFYFSSDQLAVPYLPDPLARGAAWTGLPGALHSPKPLHVPFFANRGDWPAAQSFRLVLKPGQGVPELPSPANGGALSIALPKGMIEPVLMSCFLDAADVDIMGLWEWLDAAPLNPTERAALFELITWGRHWMFTPLREVVLVHAVRQPLIVPHFGKLAVQRELGATYATLTDPLVTVDHRSTVRLDVLASWQEPFDDGRSPAGAVLLEGRSRVGELHLEYNPSLQRAEIRPMRHDFGDTKHRRVYYEALATTRFLEFFAEVKQVALSGLAPVVVSSDGFAEGATSVSATAAAGKVVYRRDADYAEDDTHGTIARLKGSSIPDGAEVVVTYVKPPTTRSSLEHPVAPATTKGYLRSVPSSARPSVPDVRYILPAFSWSSGTDSSGRAYSRRLGRLLRVYLGRPWWSSGEEELLGVVLSTHLDVGIESQLEGLFSRVGADPTWVTGSVGSRLTLSQFPLAVAKASGIVLAEQHYDRDGMADVAGHQVSFDPVHGLWFTDIAIDVPPSYWPFVRLGLARYQPFSLRTAEVSPVVQTDFAQLAPDRLATLSFPNDTSVLVAVSGPAVAADAGGQLPLSVRAFVEAQREGVTDPDLQWEPANADLTSGTPLQARSAGTDVVWQGTVELPAARGSRPMRIRLQEAELIPLDSGNTLAVEIGERVTYLDTLRI